VSRRVRTRPPWTTVLRYRVSVIGRRVLGIVVVAALAPVVGCGFVEDEPAGSAAPNDREVAVPTITTVPTPSAPSTPTVADPSDPVPSPAAPPTTVALSAEDLALLNRCELILEFREAGIDVLIVSSREPDRLVEMIRKFDSAATDVLPVLRPDERAGFEAAMATVRVGLPGIELRTPQQIIDEWNGLIGSNLPVWRQAVQAITAACPTGPADMLDQAAEFRLGAPLPPDFEARVGRSTPRA